MCSQSNCLLYFIYFFVTEVPFAFCVENKGAAIGDAVKKELALEELQSENNQIDKEDTLRINNAINNMKAPFPQ